MNSLAPPAAAVNPPAYSTTDAALQSQASRFSAYLEFAKPRIAVMVLLCVGVGFALASQQQWQLATLFHACVGILLAVVSSSSLNQYVERETDARMPRTWNRPLPSQRLGAEEVLLFGLGCGVISTIYLALLVNITTAALTLATIVLYAAAYTPLKRYTALCTVIGAVPGALPPVLGWTAAGGELNLSAFSLFAILFVWQFPHFLAIAWMYREQYAQAGLKMIPGRGQPGVLGQVSMAYALALLPVSLLPMQLDLAGRMYGITAILLGCWYAWSVWKFCRHECRERARGVLLVSLAYLPGVLLALTVDHFRLLN